MRLMPQFENGLERVEGGQYGYREQAPRRRDKEGPTAEERPQRDIQTKKSKPAAIFRCQVSFGLFAVAERSGLFPHTAFLAVHRGLPVS